MATRNDVEQAATRTFLGELAAEGLVEKDGESFVTHQLGQEFKVEVKLFDVTEAES